MIGTMLKFTTFSQGSQYWHTIGYQYWDSIEHEHWDTIGYK